MKLKEVWKPIIGFSLIFIFIFPKIFFSLRAQSVPDPTEVKTIICGCPTELQETIYKPRGERCPLGSTTADQVKDWQENPTVVHLWVEDPEVTAQGKADERARQFIYWVITHPSIDDHPVILRIWNFTRNIAYFFVLLVAGLMGIGIIIGQRNIGLLGYSNFKIDISPLILKLILILLYITFSASIVLTIIQLADILMKFFIETLGGKDLFNIYFTYTSNEKSYIDFVGCRDLNIRVQEAVKAEMFLLKMTNVTYYIMGVMLVLRKILLWFLLFVAPFLAVLMPFIFIRNIGWIWIGVFFQWVFYGPLFALFLSALSTIWKNGIPFPFNFGRTNTAEGYVYPTAINICYGGPAQKWGTISQGTACITNNGNYVDTFAEYVISLIMLWGVTFFPWWLLRIFRDYCCEGIMATKNILLSMYDQMRGAPPSPKPPSPGPTSSGFGKARIIPQKVEVPVKVRLQTIEEIKKAQTQEITRSLQLSVSKLTDIARLETNKQLRETAVKNIDYLKNPMKAETPTERQRYMELKTELYNRAIKKDQTAKQVLRVLSTSKREQIQTRQEILHSLPSLKPVTRVVAIKVKIPHQKVNTVTNSFINTISRNSQILNALSQTANIPHKKIQTVLSSLNQNIDKPINQVIDTTAKEANLSKEKVSQIVKNITTVIEQSKIVKTTATKESVSKEKVEKFLQTLPSALGENQSVIKLISGKTTLPETKVISITQTLFNNVVKNSKVLNHIKNQTGLDQVQIKNVTTTISQNLNRTGPEIIDKIHQETGLNKEKINQVTKAISNNLSSANNLVKEVAEKEHVKEEEVENVITSQAPLVAEPEKQLDQTIPIPPSVSLEDYEEVKKMWKEQYEKGEVPITENITSREQWVDQDILLLTNILNKILSPDEKLRQQALDDLSYLLPIFMINNLKGEELVVYLKAKLEAAKTVKEQLEKEKISPPEKEEELVEVSRRKKEEKEKVMRMETEIPSKERKQPPLEQLKEPLSPPGVKVTIIDSRIDKGQPPSTLLPIEELKKLNTEQIARSLNLAVSKLTDIARLEANKEKVQNLTKVITYLNQPDKAPQKQDKERYLALKQELLERTNKQDPIAEQIIKVVSAPETERIEQKRRMATTIPSPVPLVQALSSKTNLPQNKLTSILYSFINNLLTNTTLINTVTQQTNTSSQQLTSLIKSLTKNINQPINQLINNIIEETRLTRTTVSQVLKAASKAFISSPQLINDLVQKENLSQQETEAVINWQIALLTDPEGNVDQTIPIPPSVSLEDYEEVKKMWKEQYEKGEVPITENITSREQWVDQDILLLTNILNKILSPDEKLRQQALDDLSYLLPIFMINNLKGEELVVYLKAKLEAAKTVKEQLEKEEELRKRLQSNAEEFVDVTGVKKGQTEAHTKAKAQEIQTEEKNN